MEAKAVRCCVPFCLLSLGSSKFTVEKSALFIKLWCVLCQFVGFFPLALSYLLPLEIVLNIVRCRPYVRAQCEGKKRGVRKGPLWCPATGWTQLLFVISVAPLVQSMAAWQRAAAAGSAGLSSAAVISSAPPAGAR